MTTLSNSDTAHLRLREQVAACTLLLNAEGLMGYSGHVSSRVPGTDHYFIQPFETSRAGLKPSDLLICDYDGKVVEGPRGTRPPAEVFLHGEILRVRPDVNAVAHFHHDLTNVFTLVEGAKLLPLKNHSIRWVSGMPIHPDPSHVSDSKLGKAVAEVDKKDVRLIVFTDEQSHTAVPAPKGIGYMVNVASYQHGVGHGPWRRIDGFSEKILDWIIASEQD